MQFIIDDDPSEQHKNNIKTIIEALIEEQDNELEKVEVHYDCIINDAQINFRKTSCKFSPPGVQLIEEKFKLDMYKLINTVLLPRKM
jgi:hypothetical protein